MAIKRFVATADTTITNAFLEDLTTRASGANTGRADSLEVFSVYGQVSGSASSLYTGTATGSSGFSQELSRILVKFPVTTGDDSVNSIQAKRNSGDIPASGNVSFFLKMYNVAHHESLPVAAKLNIFGVSSASWEEGRGVDLDTYSDRTLNGIGANWVNASNTETWPTPGGTYHTGSDNKNLLYSQTLPNGNEDIELNISALVEEWIAGTKSNYGLGIFLTSSQEAYFSSSTGQNLPATSGGLLHNIAGTTTSFYTKKFSARSSEYFFKRPLIEARWDSAKKDDRSNFYYSSSIATPLENLNTIYFYNYFRGRLRNLPGVGTGNVAVSIFSGSADDTTIGTGSALTLAIGGGVLSATRTVITGAYVSKGIYSASFALTAAATPLKTIYDVWHLGPGAPGAVQYHTGTIKPKKNFGSNIAPDTTYVSKITNLRKTYRNDENARFRLYTRLKNWSPTIYTKAKNAPEINIIESGSYEIHRVIDDLKVVPYGTGSSLHTQMSFDASGSYFDLDMHMLESGYMYGIKMSFYNESVSAWVEQPHIFKFRVEK